MIEYTSEQVRAEMTPNGVRQILTRVEVDKNGGKKTVVIKEEGQTRKNTRTLTRKELKNVKNGVFMPGLFMGCMRPKRKVRKTHKKKKSWFNV
jgi:hypothetical protein